jgi:Haem-binding domain
MRAAKVVMVLVAVNFAAIQLIPVARSNPPDAGDPDAPAAIVGLLKRACYDCHSNQTRWPWYSFVAPVSWLVSQHVTEARQHLNFSEWEAYTSDPDTASHKLSEIADQVAGRKMAPWYYRAMHPDARLNGTERQALISWARTTSAAMKSSD